MRGRQGSRDGLEGRGRCKLSVSLSCLGRKDPRVRAHLRPRADPRAGSSPVRVGARDEVWDAEQRRAGLTPGMHLRAAAAPAGLADCRRRE